MIKFILSFTLVLNSISYSFAANSVFYFNPNLTMRVATNDSESGQNGTQIKSE